MATSTQNPAPPATAPDRVDILAGTPGTAPVGMGRLAYIAGVLCVSLDSGLYAPVSQLDAQMFAKVRAASLLGRNDLIGFFHDAAGRGTNGVSVVPSGAGAGAVAATESGALTLNGGTSGVGVMRLLGFSDGATFPRFLRSAQPWYIAGRFRATTVPAAGTQIYVGAMDSLSNKLQLGVVQTAQGANFCLTGPSGATMNSGVPFDTAYHTFEALRLGTVTSLLIDGGVAVTGNVDITTDLCPVAEVVTGTAANQAMALVWFAAAAPSR